MVTLTWLMESDLDSSDVFLFASSLLYSLFLPPLRELAQYCPHSSWRHRNIWKSELRLSPYACKEEEKILE